MMSTPKMMSVERAIQRELAYRRRMEALQFGLHLVSSSCGIPMISVQDSSIPSTSGTKRKSSYFDTPVFFQQQPPHSQPDPIRRNHRSSRPINAKITCTVCNESFRNTLYLDRHCQSIQHLNKMSRSRHGHSIGSNPFMCEICQATSSSRVSLEQHLIGRRHKQNMEVRPTSSVPRYPNVDLTKLTWESV